METIKLNNGEIKTVTSRHAEILKKQGLAEILEKEENPVIETKEEKAVIPTKEKKGRPKKQK